MGHRDEAALRGLVGAGPSRVGTGGAMRARDVSRPTEADLEAAVANLVIRRAWRNKEAPADRPPVPDQTTLAAPTPEPSADAAESAEQRTPQLRHRGRHRKRR